MGWYSKVVSDITEIPNFISFYESELLEAKKEVKVKGVIERNIAELPGITEHRFNQLQEVEAVLNYLNIQLKKIKKTYFQKYIENYPRALSSRDADKYTEGEQEVVDFETIINEVAYLRNRYLGIMKAIDAKQWQLGHLTKLKVAGMEDYNI